jgi:hypothetical protein
MEKINTIKVIVCAVCVAWVSLGAVQSHRALKTKLRYPILFAEKESWRTFWLEIFGAFVYACAILLLTLY